MYLKSVLGAIAVALAMATLLAHGRDWGRPKTQLRITEVSVDFNAQIIKITGSDFDFGPGPLRVSLGELGDISALCTDGLTSPQFISCDFSAGGLPRDGDYVLRVVKGNGKRHRDRYDLTIGAVGPQGEQGPAGDSADAWRLDGNGGTTAGVHYLGTTDNEAFEVKVDGARAIRAEPNGISANVILGKSDNFVEPGVSGAFIAGGGIIDSGGGPVTSHPNSVLANYSSITGGRGNSIDADATRSVIGGGDQNQVLLDATTSVIAGGEKNIIEAGAILGTISGGLENVIGGNAETSTVGGGSNNSIHPEAGLSVIGGGVENEIFDIRATIAGGVQNKNRSSSGTIGGGTGNNIGTSSSGSTISGGISNSIGDSSIRSVIGGGQQNIIDPNVQSGVVSGGSGNTLHGSFSAIPVGFSNETGSFSYAAGSRAKAIHNGTFVWSDASGGAVFSTANNQFVARAAGGVVFYSDAGLTTGVELPSGSGSWSTLSDRNVKDNVAEVDGKQILAQIAAMPISNWNYITQDESIRHIGPMAQDFFSAFGLGEDNRRISSVDADGIALAAIKELHKVMAEQAEELKSKNLKIQSLEERLQALEAMFESLAH